MTTRSSDGTAIAFERSGAGRPLILIEAAGHFRGFSSFSGLAPLLAADFTVYQYDRRGRGASSDTPPYAVEREVEDVAALIAHAGGSAFLFGFSSGALLALHAAASGLGVPRLALLEPPLADSADLDFTAELDRLVSAGRRADAVEYFNVEIGGWGDGQLHCYTDTPATAALDGRGRLAITARREPDGTITSARLTTKERVTAREGRIEARIKVPAGRGVWAAFWLLGADIDAVGWPRCGEIDVMEFVGSEPRTVHGTLHGPGFAGLGRGIGASRDAGVDLADDFHRYAVDWIADRITWSLDGKPYSRLARPDVPAWVFDHDFYLLLNLAIDGDWPGNATADPALPVTMLIDWVCARGPPQRGARRRSRARAPTGG